MATHRWADLKHKLSLEQQDELREAARAEIERVGLGALRKARQQTQVALAQELGVTQGTVSEMEQKSDLMLSTLARYIRAMGGELEIRAVFPEATFNLEPPATVFGDQPVSPKASPAKTTPDTRRTSRNVA